MRGELGLVGPDRGYASPPSEASESNRLGAGAHFALGGESSSLRSRGARRRANRNPSTARWSDDSITWGAHVASRTPSAVTTPEQLRLRACNSSSASVWSPWHRTLVAIRPPRVWGHRFPACYLGVVNATRVPPTRQINLTSAPQHV